MTRLASFCSGVLEVVNAVAVRVEDVVGEWVDTRRPHPRRSVSLNARERIVGEVVEAIEMYVDARLDRRQVWIDDPELVAVCNENTSPGVPQEVRWQDRAPISALIKKRDDMVAACRVTLAGRLAKFVDGVATGGRS